MANISFTTLHYRTPFLFAISRELEKRGHSVFFLCPSPKWRNWLVNRGVSQEKILDQSAAIRFTSLSQDERKFIPEIREMEKKSEITLASMTLMDRLIRRWPHDQAFNYLVRLYILLKKYILEKRIDLVIGEPTPANDLLTASLCEFVDIPYYSPFTVRIPDNRFAFFKGRNQEKIFTIKNPEQKLREEASLWSEKYLADFEKEKFKPSYWHKNNQIPRMRISWTFKFARTMYDEIRYKRSDPTRFYLTWLLKKRVGEVWNSHCLRRVRFHKLDRNSENKFILYPLHKQPESSVDVLGDFYSDQLYLIKQIVRSLPAGFKIYIKEHSNSIGDRPLGFYREVERLPNAVLISPYEDSFKLLSHASALVTISGTMAYEAGLLGTPAITMSKMFFCGLPSVTYCHSVRELPELLYAQIDGNSDVGDQSSKLKFLSWVYLNSFEGVFSDVKAYPETLEEGNVLKVCGAIEKII